jgi:hypothetical protein
LLTFIHAIHNSDISNIQSNIYKQIFNTLAENNSILFFRYTAVSVMEMDFERIDINQCPKGEGNKGPNIFANTARCKTESTEVSKI